MEILTRQDAIAQNSYVYFTGQPCSRGHLAKRYTQSSVCYECLHPRISSGLVEARRAAHTLAITARAQCRAARSRMVIRKFRVADAQLETFKAQAFGLALSYESFLEMRDLETRVKVVRLSSSAGIYPLRIFPEMEAYLRPLELQSWGDEPNDSRPIPLPADYWPSGDPK